MVFLDDEPGELRCAVAGARGLGGGAEVALPPVLLQLLGHGSNGSQRTNRRRPPHVARRTLSPCPPASASPVLSPSSPPSRWSDRKSTRLNSSHQIISYAVFCLKKKK